MISSVAIEWVLMPTGTDAFTAHRRVPPNEATTSPFSCLCTCEHKFPARAVILMRATGDLRMARREKPPDSDGRPYNNLLRRLNPTDYPLIEPHLAPGDSGANDLLYNPGDDVDVVHFPCGPSLASYLVGNEDGRDVESIFAGRGTAAGGILSQGD